MDIYDDDRTMLRYSALYAHAVYPLLDYLYKR